ncbi:MAG: IS3 family transposase [Balneolaceae bacterium]
MRPLSDRREMVESQHKRLDTTAQCRLLSVPRSSYYYKPKGISEQDLHIMQRMDRMYTEDPTRGSRRYRRDLRLEGIPISREKVRRLMKIMRIKTIYCKPRTTVIDPASYKYPYLLRGLEINSSNQVWQIDISYIPLAKGFMYLVAIIDVHSRYIVGWDISNTMMADWVVQTLQTAIEAHGAPGIINSDQGVQFTSHEYVAYVKSLDTVRISMDGKGRATDNAHIERFFRTIKYDKIYLYIPENGQELYRLCQEFITFYNRRRGHSSIGDLPPERVYQNAA